MPEGVVLKVLGLQPHTERAGQENRANAAQASKAQDKIWNRAQQIEKNWPSMSQEGKQATENSIREDAVKSGMENADVLKVLRYIQRQEQSTPSIKKGERFKERNP
jgi:hypothetical protein